MYLPIGTKVIEKPPPFRGWQRFPQGRGVRTQAIDGTSPITARRDVLTDSVPNDAANFGNAQIGWR